MAASRKPVRGWFLTYPKCDESKEILLAHLESLGRIEEYVIAREKHEDGSFHLHAFVKWENEGFSKHAILRTNSPYDFMNHHGNYQPARSRKDVIKYIKKDGDFITNIDESALDPLAKRRKMVADLKSQSVQELMENGDISWVQARQAVYARGLLMSPYEHTEVRGIWIWGVAGAGKTHKARSYEGTSFIKAQNKWFDGYDGQENIILDDYDCNMALFHYLKIWGDRWACSGEVKGGTVQLQHKRFIVTSNYSIDEMFMQSGPDGLQAIKRRFTILHMSTPYSPGE
jgi:hypothetical protein